MGLNFKKVEEKLGVTVVIWCNVNVRFFVLEDNKDYSHLHHKFMDGDVSNKISEEIFNLLYEERKGSKFQKYTLYKDFPKIEGLFSVVVTGYLL